MKTFKSLVAGTVAAALGTMIAVSTQMPHAARAQSKVSPTYVVPTYTAIAYRASAQGVPLASATDMIFLPGSSTKIVKVNRILISASATAAATTDIFLIKRVVTNSGGSPVLVPSAPLDTIVPLPGHGATPSSTTFPLVYLANPTIAGGGVQVDGARVNWGAAGVAGNMVFSFGGNTQPLTLRGMGEGLAINMNGVSPPSGGVLDITIEWTEE